MVGMRLPLQKTHARCAHERCETGRGMICCTVVGGHPVVGVSNRLDSMVADLSQGVYRISKMKIQCFFSAS